MALPRLLVVMDRKFMGTISVKVRSHIMLLSFEIVQ